MSLMTCPKYGTTSCAGGVCHVCGTLGEDVRDCAPEDDVIEVDSILGYTRAEDENFRRPTTLIRETVRKPKFDRRPVVTESEAQSRAIVAVGYFDDDYPYPDHRAVPEHWREKPGSDGWTLTRRLLCLYCGRPVQRRGLLRRWRHVV